ncbi:MAG: transcription termination/antitermination protein NusA [SAR116 cluster bacterium]|nr:transcription termination/antitermination protein NusA [SAR116 cluster bacterium]
MDETTIPRNEIIQVADIVSREKSIDREIVFEAMEEAIQKAGRSRYGNDRDIRAHIDRKNGAISLQRWTLVVEEIEDESTQISLKEANLRDDNLAIGDFIKENLPPIDFGRIAAQTAKQVIVHKVREAEREKQYEEYKDRVGDIVLGTVKRVDNQSVTVDLGRGEAVIRREDCIPRETLRQGDKVRSIIYDVRSEIRGPQIFLSRTKPEFMSALFTQEVPEIYEGIIEIKSVAREPGSRAKISVFSKDTSIDPVGACVGMRGARVQAVVNELQGEKIEIIQWNENDAEFVVSALAPSEITKVVMDEETKKMEVVVPDDQLSLAIGRRGQNVRLASILSGWYIDILTEAEESERRQEEFKIRSDHFIKALDIDDVIAHLLVAEGFDTIDDISETSVEELSSLQGFDTDIAEELKDRAISFVEKEKKNMMNAIKKLGLSEDLVNFEYLNSHQIIKLGENGVKCKEDLANLDSAELFDFLGEEGIKNEEEAGKIIMSARAHWFVEEVEDDESVE